MEPRGWICEMMDFGFGERICPRPARKKSCLYRVGRMEEKGARLKPGREVHGPCATQLKKRAFGGAK